jgi:hypothetical protein
MNSGRSRPPVTSLKLATWNLALPGHRLSPPRAAPYRLRGRPMSGFSPRTHDGSPRAIPFSLLPRLTSHDGLHAPEHRWVPSGPAPRSSLSPPPTTRGCSGPGSPRVGAPFLVYGTVLRGSAAPWRTHPSAGVAFQATRCRASTGCTSSATTRPTR